MPSVSGASHRAPTATHPGTTADPVAPPKRAVPPPPRPSVTDTPVGTESKHGDRIGHHPIPPLPGTGPQRLREWVRTQQTDPSSKPRPVEQRPGPEHRAAAPRTAAVEHRPAPEPRPALPSRASLERAEIDEQDDRPTPRPPPLAQLARSVFEPARPGVVSRQSEPANPEPEFISVAPDPISDAPEPMRGAAELTDPSARADDDELPTLPPTRGDAEDDDGDDEPTIVEPYSVFAARNLRIEDPSSDERPTDRSIRAATPMPVDARPAPPFIPARRESAPRRGAEPPPAPRVARDQELAPIGYPGAPTPAVRVITVDEAQSTVRRAAPTAAPVAPALSSQVFRAARQPEQRSKATTIAAAVGALLVIAAAGYLGAASGKRIEATAEPAPSEPSAVAKIETPPPPAATVTQEPDPRPAPSPAVEAPAPLPTREVAPEPRPPPREVMREPPAPRRATSDEEAPRPREGTRTKTRVPRPPPDEEGTGNGPPETRLPDPSEAPAARGTVDQSALRAAFAEGEAKAKSCLGATSPTGVARVSVTFAPTGEAVGAVVSGAPFANTLEGQCMAAKFRTLHVPPFTGTEVIVRKSITFQ
jgi:hypothetical protein